MTKDTQRSVRELNSKKKHKLTRRRVVKIAIGLGISSAVATNMTVDDVKASDSNQVTISLDVDGERKYVMDADYLDWVRRATRATTRIQNRFTDQGDLEDGLMKIGMVTGDGEDNPHVRVVIDDSDTGDKRRSEMPERENGVRVEVEEGQDGEGRQTCEAECWPESDGSFPGGQRVHVPFEGGATSSSRMIEDDFNWFGWTTAAHAVPDCKANGETMEHSTIDCNYAVGDGDFSDITRDVAFFEIRDDGPSTDDRNINPGDHSEQVKISSTPSEEGMAAIADEYEGEDAIEVFGQGSCRWAGELDGYNETRNVGDDNDCTDTLYDQMNVEGGLQGTSDHVVPGDSGALFFIADPNDDNLHYALGSVAGYTSEFSFTYENYGAQGFTIYDLYDRAWRN